MTTLVDQVKAYMQKRWPTFWQLAKIRKYASNNVAVILPRNPIWVKLGYAKHYIINGHGNYHASEQIYFE
jgi:hypothetical protein